MHPFMTALNILLSMAPPANPTCMLDALPLGQADKLLDVSAGCIVYHGPVGQATAFFASLGFQCPKRKGVADFLQEVTSKKDQQVGFRQLRWPSYQQLACLSRLH